MNFNTQFVKLNVSAIPNYSNSDVISYSITKQQPLRYYLEYPTMAACLILQFHLLFLIPEFLTFHKYLSIRSICHLSDFEPVIFCLSGRNIYIVGFGRCCSFIQWYLKIHCYLCNRITGSVLHTGSYIQLSCVRIVLISLVADFELV